MAEQPESALTSVEQSAARTTSTAVGPASYERLSKTRWLAVVSLTLSVVAPLIVLLGILVWTEVGHGHARGAVLLLAGAAGVVLAGCAGAVAILVLARTRQGRLPRTRGMAIAALVFSSIQVLTILVVFAWFVLLIRALTNVT